MKQIILGCLVLAGCGVSTATSTDSEASQAEAQQPVRSFRSVGGSVLTYFDVGNYPQNPTPATWDSDVKGMIAWYHLNPASVRAKLQAMYAAGQRRVGVVLWFVEPDPSATVIARAHYVIPRADFTLHPQHRANLLAFVRDANALGFEEVQIRFGQQGGATPHCYRNPACYSAPEPIENPFVDEAIAFNWAFMKSVITLVEGSGVSIRRLYDLGLEFPGIRYMATKPVWYRFTSEIWRRYQAELRGRGIDATMSFNHADAQGTEVSFRMFDQLGWPNRLAMDVYENIYGNLGTFADALARHGKAGTPVFIQETFRNDPATADELVRASRDFGIDIPFVMQWPAPGGRPDLMVTDLSPFSEYLNLASRALPAPRPSLGSISVDSPTCTIPAGASSCSAIIRWTTTGVTNVVVKVDHSNFAGGTSGAQSAPWIPASYVRFDLYGDGQYIGSTRVTGVPAGLVATMPTGTLTTSASQCTIPAGGASCGVTVSWSTSNASQVAVKVGTQTASTASQGSQTVQVPQGSTTISLWANGAQLASRTVTAVAAAGGGSGTISASPSQCTIPAGGARCSSTISWTTTGVTDARVRIDGQLFGWGATGSQAAPWIGEQPAVFELWGDGVLLRTVSVRGVKATGAGLIQATPASCRVGANGLCTVNLSWNVPGANNVQIRIGQGLFASTGPTGNQDAPWIGLQPAVFEVWADGSKVDTLTVQGVP